MTILEEYPVQAGLDWIFPGLDWIFASLEFSRKIQSRPAKNPGREISSPGRLDWTFLARGKVGPVQAGKNPVQARKYPVQAGLDWNFPGLD